MKSVEMPRRGAWAKDRARLVKLDAKPRPSLVPDRLGIHNLLTMDALFQPRGQSLGFAPGASAKHVIAMANAVRDGRLLDPVSIVAFGDRWVLIDGHHRLAAYRDAGFADAIPVKVYETDRAGQERVIWAMALSVALNAKDKLAMSADDKSDSAWRLVALVGDGLSKRQLADGSTVKDRTIGYMRAVRKALTDAGWTQERLYETFWRSARFEAERLKGNDSEPDPEAEEKRMRRLMKKLAPAIDERLPALILLEALERLRPGLELELESAIQLAKERRRNEAEAPIAVS